MNEKPHTHQVKVEEGSYRYYLTYGDQSKKVGKRWLECRKIWRRRSAKTLERMINRRVRRMIRRHDRQSVKAGTKVISPMSIATNFNEHLLTKDEQGYSHTMEAWGGEILKQKVSS